MTSIFTEEQLSNLSRYVVKSTTEKYMLFTKLKDLEGSILYLCLSNGYNVYVKELDEDIINDLVEECECGGTQTFFSLLKSSLSISGDIHITEVADSFFVRLGSGVSSISMTLKSPTATVKQELFQYIFFDLAEQLQKYQAENLELKNALEKYHNDETIKGSSSNITSDVYEPELKRSRQQTGVKQRVRKGASLINPSIRKKKPATGVVFGDD